MSTRARASRPIGGGASVRARKQQDADDTAMDIDNDGKEGPGAKTKLVNGRGTRKPKGVVAKKVKDEQLESVDCICSNGDDGSPMILCSECKIWYHFTCVDITEPQAEEINVYVCPSCAQTTGRRSAMNWEGDQAVEECTEDDDATIVQRRKAAMKTRPKHHQNGNVDGKRRKQDTQFIEALKFEAESDDGDDSEDEYIDENEHAVGRKKRIRRLSTTSSTSKDDADSADDGSRRRRIARLKHSRSPSVHTGGVNAVKRKAKSASLGKGFSPAPPPKRKRSGTTASVGADNSAQEDAVRKYCLSKLEDMFKEVFLRYPYVRLKEEEDYLNEEGEKTNKIRKELTDLTDEEKEALVNDARRFACELETCVYETYVEPDKHGNLHAGAKYKDRFRTLQFNLSKPDRVVIHQRIVYGNLSAKEISTMSSTDLADEEMKQSIKQAEKEALEHSILQKQTAPRAKITHKGLQDIEDVRGENASAQDFELEKEREEEERRERERLARLKTNANQTNRQRTASMSVPPESPIAPPSATSPDSHQQQQWGAPPPVPFHAMVTSPVDETAQEQRLSFFSHPSSDLVTPEPELKLDDLINIDDDQDGTHGKSTTEDSGLISSIIASPTEMTFPTPSPISTTGISPFAQRSDTPREPSFDLNILWSEQPPAETAAADSHQSKVAPAENKATMSVETRDDSDNMELESVEANDQDFDMFLADEAEAEPPVVPSQSPCVESLPQVWTGKITMPLDSGVTQETVLMARQVGGKPLPADSPLWRTLFPSDMLRIEGRVPVDSSIKYLVQMRLNPSKELYAVAFVPPGPQNEDDFKTFNNFLISKSRHGLVFPWGKPKDYHPGRELYMIPLLQTDSLPEFIELLDDLKLPKDRSRDYLIGVWILNKGKLASLPGPSSHPPSLVKPPAALPQPTVPSLQSNSVQLAPQIPQLGGIADVPQPPNTSLTSEVASLTPDQIQNLLRSLTSTSQVPPVTQLGQPPFPLPQAIPPQPWMSQATPPPSFPFSFPPPNVPFQQHQQQQPHQGNSPIAYDRQPDRKESDRPSGGFDRDYWSGSPHDSDRNYRGNDRGDRGWRGYNRGRGGRGRGRGDGHDRDFRGQRDSGWPRRPRSEGQEGTSW